MGWKSILKLGIAWVVLFAVFMRAPHWGLPLIAGLMVIPLIVCTIMLVTYTMINIVGAVRGWRDGVTRGDKDDE